MKLLACSKCSGIINLRRQIKACPCGAVGGRYLADGLHAVYWGPAIRLAISNPEFLSAAAREQTDEAHGEAKVAGHEFHAWIIPWDSPRLVAKRRDEVEAIGDGG